MKLFECQNCRQRLYFENTRCEHCSMVLGYIPEASTLSALSPSDDGYWQALAAPGQAFRFCANAAHGACNWLVPRGSDEVYCRACRHNRTIPDLSDARNLLLWQRIEGAKHRLFYGLLRLGLPLVDRRADATHGLAFDFLGQAPEPFGDSPQVMTGHAEGLITLDISEADDAARERHRLQMAEPYRTLLGHLRHEIGHHYWETLVRNGVWHRAFRDLFGDERQDYAEALQTHYNRGPLPNWQDHYISSYASAHPWEDFAECWAHYLHILDTLETAHAFQLQIAPRTGRDPELARTFDIDPYEETDFDRIFAAWPSLTFAINSLSHSMGQPDLYPFVLTPTVMGKLRFVHGLVQTSARHSG
ncbi:MAG: zinc-binding metallopeptidase family protein [Pseudomonadota bacterium]